jgi:hypothetical protein
MGIPIGTWGDSTTNQDVFKRVVRTWYNFASPEALVQYPQVFHEVSTEDEYEREGRKAGLGPMSKVPEGGNIPLESPKLFGVKDYHQEAYGLGFRITHRMKKFNKIDLMQDCLSDLKKRMKEDKDIEVAKLYNNATSTTAGAVGFDTLALASTAHTLLTDAAPTSYSNYGNADLGTASYEAARIYFQSVYDDRGFIQQLFPKTLVVNKNFTVRANQICYADKKPFEMSNTKYDLNQYFGGVVTPFPYLRLTSSTSWFLITDTKDKNFGPRVYTSGEPELVTKDGDDRTMDTQVMALQYFKWGLTDARRVYVGNI